MKKYAVSIRNKFCGDPMKAYNIVNGTKGQMISFAESQLT